MHNRFSAEDHLSEQSIIELDSDTARWTSPAYGVRFGRIAEIIAQSAQQESFRVSAWGLSAGLTDLLADFSESELHYALDWLTIRQNAYVVVLLEDAMASDDFNFEMIDQIFISIDAELFLPCGLRMHVTCITNIVQAGADQNMLDKFVAVLDPGEAAAYVSERRGMTVSKNPNAIH